jgi:hypothetical protein
MTEVLERRFGAIGARVHVARPQQGAPRIDVVRDRDCERFDIRFAGRGDQVELEVVDVAPDDRHLLLLVRAGGEKSKFLLGYDERHWFVAAVPEDARGVTGVAAAKQALQPVAVQAVVERKRPKDRFRRRNAAYVRQGEWFFVPAPELQVADTAVLRNEVLTRGRGNPHVMQFAFRRGGEVVYVSHRYPSGLTQARFEKLSEKTRRKYDWQQLVRDPEVYARGTVRHPDHATIHLHVWHRVLMNTEQRAQAMRHVAFID